MGVGVLLLHNSLTGPVDDHKPYTRPAAVTHATPPSAAAAAADQALPRAMPERLSIPEIAVDAPFTRLSIGASGQLNAPPAGEANLVGWFEGGVSPGERGSSIVVGHVDTKTGPAVFAQLRQLKPGSMVYVTRADDTVARFKVDSLNTFSKDRFPDHLVYADTRSPQLRLITCDGAYNHVTHDYEANLVVFAHLDPVGQAGGMKAAPSRAPRTSR
ncbi:class F sortase [Streptomyces sp. NPDC048420]|uniref:class F sortase n=1 Tax=Streptomyces sp. NPDC048420 TaxID=3155755 RepID=UPI0034222504